jgi:hypothetical protein
MANINMTQLQLDNVITAINSRAKTTDVNNELSAKLDKNVSIVAGTATKVVYDTKGLITSGTTLAATDIPNLDTSKITSGTLPVIRGGTGVTTSTGSGSVVLSTSPTLVTPNIGVATGTSFNSITGLSSTNPSNNGTVAVGTATTAARADHVHASDTTKVTANANITAGTGTKITYDAKGLVTAGTQMTLEDIPDSRFKKSVRCATTANLGASYSANVLTMSAVGVTVLDGITLILNDRVLIKDQTTALQNGIYRVSTLGTASVATVFTRALDADVTSELASAIVAVDSGTINGGRLFDNDLKTTDALGTTAVTFNLVVDTGFASTVVGSTPGTASIGTSTSYARADHVHPVQTTITGNAGSATVLQTARNISGVSFNGSANIEIEDRLGTAIASAATITVGTRGLGDYIHITGTTTITSLDTAAAAGIRRTLIFDEALTLTHNATSLICPGAASIVTVAGTVIEVVAETTENWRVVSITHPSLSMTELGYLDGVTSNVQTQLNNKYPDISSVTSPNNTVNAIGISASSAETVNADLVLLPKGTGALITGVPSWTDTKSGSKRGQGAIDLQLDRTNPDAVAAGNYSVCLGANNSTFGYGAVALGTNANTGYIPNYLAFSGTRISGSFITANQFGILPLIAVTTSATAVRATTDGNPLNVDTESNQFTIGFDSGCSFRILAVARRPNLYTLAGIKGFEVTGVMTSGLTVSSFLVSTGTVTAMGSGTLGASLAVTADTVNGALAINCTGIAGVTINWEIIVIVSEITKT